MKAAAVSSRGVASAGKLATSPVETCVFWMRRGHLLLALNRPVDAVAAYATAAKAEPHSLAANEARELAREAMITSLLSTHEADEGKLAELRTSQLEAATLMIRP